MSIRRVTCPGCGTQANVPAAMTNVKCPSCGMVWNVNQPVAAKQAAPEPAPKAAPKAHTKTPKKTAAPTATKTADVQGSGNAAMIAGLVGGGVMLVAIMGIGIVIVNRSPTNEPAETASAAVEVEETIKPAMPVEYREINKPEAVRKRIYNDYRQVARTTIEKPLVVPQGTAVRGSLEGMLQKTFDRELTRFAALHDITVEDVQEVIKEGDAKQWDKSPRSNAVRDGKRVYPKEMSEGWEKNKNRK